MHKTLLLEVTLSSSGRTPPAPHTKEQDRTTRRALVVLSCSRFAVTHLLVSPPQSMLGELANLLSTAQ